MQIVDLSNERKALRRVKAPVSVVKGLLEELKSTSELMQDLARANVVLHERDRRQAAEMSDGLAALYQSGKRSASDV